MNESRNNKPFYKRKWFAYTIAILILLSAIAAFTQDSEEQAEQPAQAVAEEKPKEQAEAKSVEEVPKQLSLADEVNAYLGDRRIHGQGVKDGYYTIETDFGRFIGPEFCEEESIDLAQIVSEHPDYAATGANGVKVVYISGVTDAYGNSTDDTVMYIAYSNATISQINFDNFDMKNVVAVADDYFRMASFK